MASLEIIVIKSFFLCLFFVVSIVGNVLVCYAIYSNKKLRTVPNYLVFSLAVADVLFAVVGMPMIIVTSIAGEWVLGDAACQISGIANSLLCLCSIWTLTVISVNRYYAVGKAMSYKRLFTKKRVLIAIFAVWFLSSLMALMPLFGWSRIRAGDSFCTIDGRSDKSYAMLIVLLAYIAPLLIIVGLYARIYFILKRHEETLFKNKSEAYASSCSADGSSFASEANHNQIVDVSYSLTREDEKSTTRFAIFRSSKKKAKKLSVVAVSAPEDKEGTSSNSKSSGSTTEEEAKTASLSGAGGLEPSPTSSEDGSVRAQDIAMKSCNRNSEDESLDETRNKTADEDGNNVEEEEKRSRSSGEDDKANTSGEDETAKGTAYIEMKTPTKDRKISQSSLSVSGLRGRITATLKGRAKVVSKRKRFAKEARITRMLFVVVLVFFICWTPLSVGAVLYGLKVESSSFGIMNFGITMACLNSACNPIIYAFMSTTFRRAFIEIFQSIQRALCCSKKKH